MLTIQAVAPLRSNGILPFKRTTIPGRAERNCRRWEAACRMEPQHATILTCDVNDKGSDAFDGGKH